MRLDDIQYDDLNDLQKELADVIGMDGLFALTERFAGASIYIPYFEEPLRNVRNRNILSDKNSGMGVLELSRKYRLTTVRIRDILNAAKKSECSQKENDKNG